MKRALSYLRFTVPIGFWVTLLVLLPAAFAQEVAPQITERIDESKLVALSGSRTVLAQSKFDRGAIDDSAQAEQVLLVLRRSATQEASLNNLISSQNDPSSPNYHKWLTPAEFGAAFGPATSDIETVKVWLQSHGFTINKVSAGRTLIEFSGTAGQLRTAFHTEIHSYAAGDVTFHANSSDPQIPRALAPVIRGFASLNDIKPRSFWHSKGRASYDPRTHRGTPQWIDPICNQASNSDSVCTLYLPTPADIATQYNITQVYKNGNTGTGRTIGIISDSNVDLSNVQNYRKFFNIANPNNLPRVIVDGTDPGQNTDGEEAYLDVEVSGALAPSATVDLYVSGNTLTTSGLFTALARAVDDDEADVISVSYGECEATLGQSGNQFMYEAWQQAAAQGQSVFVSAGDSGSAGCDNAENYSPAVNGLAVSGFASTPFNVAVGGTDFYYSQYGAGYGSSALTEQLTQYWGTNSTNTPPAGGDLRSPLPEQPWNDMLGLNVLFPAGNTIAAGSGGASSCATDSSTSQTGCSGYAKPGWQVGPGVPADGVRDIPDLSLFAADGANMSAWPICIQAEDCTRYINSTGSVSLTTVGGTSASSPAMAAIMALVDSAQRSRLGNPDHVFYALAAQYPETFNDVTEGSNDVICFSGTSGCSQDTNNSYDSLQLYPATKGYDLASGLGSVNVESLIANWDKVKMQPTTTLLSLSSDVVPHGTPVTARASVNGFRGIPTGSVALVATSSDPGQAGQGVINLRNATGSTAIVLPGGQYTVTGTYSGDGTFASSTSEPAYVSVAPEASGATLTVNALIPNYEASYTPTPVTNGSSLAYGYILVLDTSVAGVSGQGFPTGTITYVDQVTRKTIGTANLNSFGVAEFQTYALGFGTHKIVATYNGDKSFKPSVAAAVSFSITQGQTYLYSEDDSWMVPVYSNQPFQVPFILGGGNSGIVPTGSITVTLGSQTQVVPIVAGDAQGQPLGIGTAIFNNLAPGTYTLNLSYPGDANYVGTTAYPETITVSAPPTNLLQSVTTVTTSTTNAGNNGTFTMTVHVTGDGSTQPTGQVAFFLNGSPVAGFFPPINLDSTGQASTTLTNYNLFTGTNEVTAAYLGDTNYTASNSAQVAVKGNEGDFTITTPNPNIVVSASGSGEATITAASLGVNGTVNLACSTSSPAVVCSFASNKLSLSTDGTQVSTRIIIRAQTHAGGAPFSKPVTQAHGHIGGLLAGSGISLAVFFLWIPARRRKLLGSVFILLMLTGIGFSTVGCGAGGRLAAIQQHQAAESSSSSAQSAETKPLSSAQPAVPETYNVTVTASDAGIIHTLALRVTVQ